MKYLCVEHEILSIFENFSLILVDFFQAHWQIFVLIVIMNSLHFNQL